MTEPTRKDKLEPDPPVGSQRPLDTSEPFMAFYMREKKSSRPLLRCLPLLGMATAIGLLVMGGSGVSQEELSCIYVAAPLFAISAIGLGIADYARKFCPKCDVEMKPLQRDALRPEYVDSYYCCKCNTEWD